MHTSISIEPLLQLHWQRVQSIYEDGINTQIATFETSAPSWEMWDKGHIDFGRLVALHNDEVVGWAVLSKVSSRLVYRGVAEVSVYVAAAFQGQGIGKMLLQHLIEESERNNIWTLQAGIFTDNISSVKLHESVGFRLIGFREKIGKLQSEWKDNYIMERRSKIVGIE